MKRKKVEMSNCIFCNILNGSLDAAKIWEDENHIAVLDIYPNMKGMTLVISKTHRQSDLSDMSTEEYQSFFLAARKVSDLLKKSLNVKRVSLVLEGMGINHAHIKLYPLHGLESTFKEMWGKETVYFEKYEGYISTLLGPKTDMPELKKLAQLISKAS
jgi:histidine triad (HIT) family protein